MVISFEVLKAGLRLPPRRSGDKHSGRPHNGRRRHNGGSCRRARGHSGCLYRCRRLYRAESSRVHLNTQNHNDDNSGDTRRLWSGFGNAGTFNSPCVAKILRRGFSHNGNSLNGFERLICQGAALGNGQKANCLGGQEQNQNEAVAPSKQRKSIKL